MYVLSEHSVLFKLQSKGKEQRVEWIQQVFEDTAGNLLSFHQVKKLQSNAPITMWEWVLSTWQKDILSMSRTCSAYQQQTKNMFIFAR